VPIFGFFSTTMEPSANGYPVTNADDKVFKRRRRRATELLDWSSPIGAAR
jgi:hypothetical protein